MKIGSLFDGSGGFPLAASMCGIKPVWASEIEPYPIAVTCSRFPNMKHLGSVTDINGAEVEPVDIITFGSPCQDLSVAGKRAGLKHEVNGDDETTRSGLFMEAVRIIREMRRATNGNYPKWAVWENVPGAFSSNKGEDFRIVLEELIKTVEPNAVMPPVPKNGWPYADCYYGDGWSLAYRVFDAQFWGVPQRRRRIYLVLDLTGERAGSVLFEREGLRGHFAKGRKAWEAATGNAENCIGGADREGEPIAFTQNQRNEVRKLNNVAGALAAEPGMKQQTFVAVPYTFEPGIAAREGGHIYEGVSGTLRANAGDNQIAIAYTENLVLDDQGGSQIGVRADGKSPTLRAEMHGNVPCVMEAAGFKPNQGSKAMGIGWEDDVAPTLLAGQEPAVCYSIENHPADSRVDIDKSGKAQTLTSRMGTGGGNVPMVMEPKPVYCLQGNGIDRADTANCNGKGWKEDTCYTLNTIDRPAVVFQTYQKVTGPLMANSHPGSYTGQDAFSDMLVAGKKPAICGTFQNTGQGWWNETPVGATVRTPCGGDAVLANVCVEVHGMDCRNGELNGDLCGTLQAKPNGGFSYNCIHPVIVKTPVHYIVRRLTPTECARLQGFPDEWGHPVRKEELTEQEYTFWLNVRNTHAAINGKVVKEYTKDQMLAWYNKLHTDSAEYKMWGNGIALPCALYVMEGIAEASGTDICAIEDRRNALEFCPICGGSNGLHEFTTENGRRWGCSVCGWEDAT